jgi:ribokinase
MENTSASSENIPRICMVGSCNVDLIARVPRMPQPGETLAGTHFQIGFGGKGANQAVMAAKLGAKVSVVGRVGNDVFGKDTLRNFHELGVDTTYLGVDDTLPSGVAPITVDETTGQNSIIIVPGANYGFGAVEVHETMTAIQGASVIICQLEILLETTKEAFRVARAAKHPPLTILNPAPAVPLPDDLLQLTDILIPNETETTILTGLPVDSDEQAETAARALQARGVKTVIITLGKRGALFVEGDAAAQFVAAQPVQAVDSTGAGDAFVGSLAYFLGAGRPLRQAVEKACAIATKSVLKTGTQTSFPTRAEVPEVFRD